MTEDEWDYVLGVNLKGIFLSTREVTKVMIEQGEGCIARTHSLK